ncbi:hypothetical protein [Aeromonas bivalvium]|uniref:hypothetical protein n=1 Tax=Aeromonas bivalvium TaxID=440079 RepID=UPI0038D190C7
MMKIVAWVIQALLWGVLCLAPLLLLLALGAALCLGLLAQAYWGWVMAGAGAMGLLLGAWLAERVRHGHGLVSFYGKLMSNRELDGRGA